jgi:hypothetical protein
MYWVTGVPTVLTRSLDSIGDVITNEFLKWLELHQKTTTHSHTDKTLMTAILPMTKERGENITADDVTQTAKPGKPASNMSAGNRALKATGASSLHNPRTG